MQACSPGRLGHNKGLLGLNNTIIGERAIEFFSDIGDYP